MATLKKAVAGVGLVLLTSPAYAQGNSLALDDASLILLAASVLFGVCVLMVSGFAIWQSHKYYVDQVNLSHKIIESISEMTMKLLVESTTATRSSARPSADSVLQTGTVEPAPVPSSNPSPEERRGGYPGQASLPSFEKRVQELEAMLDARERKLRDIEARMSNLEPMRSYPDPDAAELERQLDALDDTELAVLQKLAQTPDFFEDNSFATFGTTSKVLDSLTEKKLVSRDASGRTVIPQEVVTAMRSWTPGRR